MPQKLVNSPLCPSEQVTEEQLKTDLAVLELDGSVQSLNRRSFFSSITALGAAAAAAGLLAYSPAAKAQAAAGPSIVDVLNFALNFEYLEANLYIAVTGSQPLTAYLGAGAPTLGLPSPISFDAQTLATVQNLVADETHHIELLRAAIFQLGGTPINQPMIDYSLGGKMSITTQAQFLAVARQFTTVGNGAYTGGAQYLAINPLALTVAGQILGAEAQHLGGINVLCALQGVLSPMVDAMDVPPVPVPNPAYFTITPTTTAPSLSGGGPALGPILTPSQVLGIVYGASTPATVNPATGIASGGFFPKGVNGAITTT